MSKTLVSEVITLVRQGWRPYSEKPESTVYTKVNCPSFGKKSIWFVRGDIFLCIGCPKHCTLSRPEGFILPLPIKYNEKLDQPYSLTPQQMVERKNILQVGEAAYCLNVSERTIYDWIACGRLRALKDNPKRVSSEDVKFEMNNFDE